jgi:hypothetical protein
MGEFYMYSAVFRRRPEIQACLHAHPFHAPTEKPWRSVLGTKRHCFIVVTGYWLLGGA